VQLGEQGVAGRAGHGGMEGPVERPQRVDVSHATDRRGDGDDLVALGPGGARRGVLGQLHLEQAAGLEHLADARRAQRLTVGDGRQPLDDMGKVISNANHPAIAAEMIRPWVSDESYWVVKVHQDFEGMHYYDRMGLDPMMRRKHADHPYYELAERFADQWDQFAFDPDYPTLPLEHFEPMVREVFGRPPRRG